MRGRIVYEFEFDLHKGEQYNQDILDCIEEDAEDAIKASIANITEGVETTLYKVEKIQ